MVNPFKDVNWSPDAPAIRSFAKSLIIGFPILAAVFMVFGFVRTGHISGGPLWLGAIGALLGAIFFVAPPTIARPFYLVWYFLACCIGIVVSNVLVGAFFYTVIVPTGFIMRALGRDSLQRKFDPSAITYWENAERNVDPKRYFRQF